MLIYLTFLTNLESYDILIKKGKYNKINLKETKIKNLLIFGFFHIIHK